MILDDKKDKRIFLLYYLIIAVITFITYYPSLFHMPRSDHFVYLANTANQNDFFSLTFKNYALNRMDLSYGMKDELLFRPLLYIFLGFEKWLFGLNFIYWQLTGILLHLAVLWFLLKFLYETHKSFWAFLFTLYFAVLFAGSEMVVWSHINGYMIFIICILAALSQIQSFIKREQIHKHSMIYLICVLTLAAFIYELGSIFCLLFAIYFYLSFIPKKPDDDRKELLSNQDKHKASLSKKTALTGLCLPAFLYFLFSFLDLHYRNLELPIQSNISFSGRQIIELAQNTASALLWWLHSGIFPSRVFAEIGQRTFMYPLFIDFSGKPPLSSLVVIQTSAGIGLLLTYFLIIVTNINKTFIYRKWKLLSLSFCLSCTYALTISLGRIAARGFERILVENSYYHYFFWTFFIIFIFNSIPVERLKSRTHTTLQTIFTMLFIILIVFNYRFTSILVLKQAQKAKAHRILNRHIQVMERQYADSGSFSFRIDPAVNTDSYYLNWAKRTSDPDEKSYNYFELLYPDYYVKNGARFIYMLNENGTWGWRETIY